ncbi:hypothetical protein OQI_38645 [Streptomyces pharetrae CZA14]|uniref:Uncharacterized protein n=1 Tax=Streptomyces pharetrae CZA14 TaxID=1144883 RepID=A0ABX3Y8X6_9ACTN|nr:hypothetical protein OQI_38645 [Streptomyces pharetrae CZA14]
MPHPLLDRVEARPQGINAGRDGFAVRVGAGAYGGPAGVRLTAGAGGVAASASGWSRTAGSVVWVTAGGPPGGGAGRGRLPARAAR